MKSQPNNGSKEHRFYAEIVAYSAITELKARIMKTMDNVGNVCPYNMPPSISPRGMLQI